VRTLKVFLENGMAPRRIIMVIGILKDKAWKPMLQELAGLADCMILSRPQYERAADPEELAAFVRPIQQDLRVISHLPGAISLALDEARHGDLVCITGSLYTVGEAKAYLETRHASR
jgi:dihydrofolate synthase/folylpolyglutamate synthase